MIHCKAKVQFVLGGEKKPGGGGGKKEGLSDAHDRTSKPLLSLLVAETEEASFLTYFVRSTYIRRSRRPAAIALESPRLLAPLPTERLVSPLDKR